MLCYYDGNTLWSKKTNGFILKKKNKSILFIYNVHSDPKQYIVIKNIFSQMSKGDLIFLIPVRCFELLSTFF